MNDIEITRLVADTFKTYFGDERICGKYVKNERTIDVILYTPILTITNENGQSHTITDLYTNIKFLIHERYQDTIVLTGLNMKRGSISCAEYKKDYIHSHARYNGWTYWAHCCLGTGPLNNLVSENISVNEMEILNICSLVEQYQRVESVSGVPYNYLNKLNDSDSIRIYSLDTSDYRWVNQKFLAYVIKSRQFDFHFHMGAWYIKGAVDEQYLKLGYLWYQYCIENEDLDTYEKCVVTYEYRDYGFYRNSATQRDRRIDNFDEHVEVLKFKGKPVYLKLTDKEVDEESKRIVHLYKHSEQILYAIQALANTYGNEAIETKNSEGNKRCFKIA